MKRISSALIFVCLSNVAIAQKNTIDGLEYTYLRKKYDTQKINEKQLIARNRIKETNTYKFKYLPGLPAGDSILIERVQYDHKGNKLLMVENNPGMGAGNFRYFVSAYDVNGNELSSTIYTKGYPNTPDAKLVYKYNTLNQNTEMDDFSTSGLRDKFIFNYDNRGNLVLEQFVQRNGNTETRYEYNNKNEKIKQFSSMSAIRLVDTTIYNHKVTYTPNGEVHLFSKNNNASSAFFSLEYDYDLKGNNTKQFLVFPDGKVVFTEDKFNAKNQLIESVSNTWKLASRAASVKMLTLKGTERKIKTYDKDGNLVVVAIYENGLLTETEKYYYKKF